MSSDSSADGVIRTQVAEADGGLRLDRLVARLAGVSRRVARTWISSGRVRVGGKVTRILTRPIAAGRRIEIEPPRDGSSSSDERAVADVPVLAVLHMDREIVVIDKPAGLLTDGQGDVSPSVESLLPAQLGAGRRGRIWLVHRLDAPTSGVLVVARTRAASAALGDGFRDGAVEKTYLALVAGRLERSQEVNAPIGRVRGTRHGVVEGGKPAATRVVPLRAGDWATLVEAIPRTGRTHQIRVHLAHLGHPLLGDGPYGGPRYTDGASPIPVGRTMLHARRLRFEHPTTGERMSWEAPVPPDFVELARRCGVWPEDGGV